MATLDTATARPGSAQNGMPARDISRDIVSLHKRYFGRGPVHVRTHVLDDAVLVVMGGGHAAHERTLAENGHAERVGQTRSMLHKALRAAYVNAVEQRLGRRVIGFMSDSESDADLECQVYVLEVENRVAPEPRTNGSGPGI